MAERQRAMEEVVEMLEFYRGRKVFVTGHTGFKGTWLCRALTNAGALVTGYSLKPPTEPSLFEITGMACAITSVIGDIRDLDGLKKAMWDFSPEIVIHMAAQPIVRESYKNPVGTYATNVMGTVNLLEAVRGCPRVKSVVNVTTDKVYRNNEWPWGYREDEYLDGYDPYSNSKSCSELVTSSYRNSFFNTDASPAVSTMRAGNVIGGGDFAADRIIPDCVRAALKGETVKVRNPCSVRPFQHVLEPVMAYLTFAAQQYENKGLAGSYNVGPEDCDCVTTGELTEMFCWAWGEGMSWVNLAEKDAPHEANFLKLDCSKLKSATGWAPRWHIAQAVEKTVEWTKCWIRGGDVLACMDRQMEEYLRGR